MSIPSPFNHETSFTLPEEKERLLALWWRPAQISKAWGCSRATAYRLIKKHRKSLHLQLIWVQTPKRLEVWEVIPANTPRPEEPRGNPAFRDRMYQSRTARAREAKRRGREE